MTGDEFSGRIGSMASYQLPATSHQFVSQGRTQKAEMPEVDFVGLPPQKRKWVIDTSCCFWWYHPPFWEWKMYAVIETGGKQYRVTPGDTLDVERLPAEAGQLYTFERVLLVANEGKVSVGAPTVAQASVMAAVTAHL